MDDDSSRHDKCLKSNLEEHDEALVPVAVSCEIFSESGKLKVSLTLKFVFTWIRSRTNGSRPACPEQRQGLLHRPSPAASSRSSRLCETIAPAPACSFFGRMHVSGCASCGAIRVSLLLLLPRLHWALEPTPLSSPWSTRFCSSNSPTPMPIASSTFIARFPRASRTGVHSGIPKPAAANQYF